MHPGDESVKLLIHEPEKLDYTLLYQVYSAKVRSPTYQRRLVAGRTESFGAQYDYKISYQILTDACKNLFYQMIHMLIDARELSKKTVVIG